MNARTVLTKQRFVAGADCDRRMWYDAHEPETESALGYGRRRLLEQGLEIGRRARDLFPHGKLVFSRQLDGDITRADASLAAAVVDTAALVEAGETCLLEAAFAVDGLAVVCDVLRKNDDGSWEIVEVKSATDPKDVSVLDVAFQTYVLRRCGLRVDRAFLMLVDSERCVFPDLSSLLSEVDVMAQVETLLCDMDGQVARLADVLGARTAPSARLAARCAKPHACPYWSRCAAHVPRASVFTIPRLTADKLSALVDAERFGLDDLSDVRLTDKQRAYVRLATADVVRVDHAGVTGWVDGLAFPLAFLDFETLNPAVPRFDGMRPYESFPFQFSLHVLEADGTLRHAEYLHDGNADPRGPLAAAVAAALPSSGTVVAYHASFEKAVLGRLAEDVPEHASALESAASRLADLEHVFLKGWIEHAGFLGRTSIKKVLPVLVPEMGYDGLAVADGTEAQGVWDAMLKTSDVAKRAELRTGLVDYCRQDTLAMVEIYRRVADAAWRDRLAVAV